MSDLSFCYNEWDAFYIFVDINDGVNYYKNNKEYNRKTEDEWLKIVLRDHIIHIGRIMDSYKKKKDYLKIFKN